MIFILNLVPMNYPTSLLRGICWSRKFFSRLHPRSKLQVFARKNKDKTNSEIDRIKEFVGLEPAT